MASDQRPTPLDSDIPGGWIETPADFSRQQSFVGSQYNADDYNTEDVPTPRATESTHSTFISNTYHTSSGSFYGGHGAGLFSDSSHSTAVPSPEPEPIPHVNDDRTTQNVVYPVEPQNVLHNKDVVSASTEPESHQEEVVEEPMEKLERVESLSSESENEQGEGYAAIKPAEAATARPQLQSKQSKPMTEDDLFRTLSRRRTSQGGGLSKTNTGASGTSNAEDDEINNLMSKMFGHTRQESSEEEKTRHHGVIFKHLTVKGMGIGAALQPSVGDLFLNPFRFGKNLVTKGPKKAAGKPPVRTLIDDFTGCLKSGEMLLVLGMQFGVQATHIMMADYNRPTWRWLLYFPQNDWEPKIRI
jgi:ATP-binding cassette subfamily G (WHITE) protein 2 (SNQ2)